VEVGDSSYEARWAASSEPYHATAEEEPAATDHPAPPSKTQKKSGNHHRKRSCLLSCLLLCFLISPSGCREAAGVPEDPVDREAEEAFVGYLKIDTSNPPGNESRGAIYLRDLLIKNGIAA
jgi:hypothetical protein